MTYVLIIDLTSDQLTQFEMFEKYEEFKRKNLQKYLDIKQPFPDYPFNEPEEKRK